MISHSQITTWGGTSFHLVPAYEELLIPLLRIGPLWMEGGCTVRYYLGALASYAA